MEWIPTIEKNPDKGGKYLVTILSTVTGERRIALSKYSEDSRSWGSQNVIAWMDVFGGVTAYGGPSSLDSVIEKKNQIKAEREELAKMVFELRKSGLSMAKISRQIDKSPATTEHYLWLYLDRQSEKGNKCIQCKYADVTDHLTMSGVWFGSDCRCKKINFDVRGGSCCEEFEQITPRRITCSECVNCIGRYYHDSDYYIRCDIHDRAHKDDTCSHAKPTDRIAKEAQDEPEADAEE